MTEIEVTRGAKEIFRIQANGEVVVADGVTAAEAVAAALSAHASRVAELEGHLTVALETLQGEGVCGPECLSCADARKAPGRGGEG